MNFNVESAFFHSVSFFACFTFPIIVKVKTHLLVRFMKYYAKIVKDCSHWVGQDVCHSTSEAPPDRENKHKTLPLTWRVFLSAQKHFSSFVMLFLIWMTVRSSISLTRSCRRSNSRHNNISGKLLRFASVKNESVGWFWSNLPSS